MTIGRGRRSLAMAVISVALSILAWVVFALLAVTWRLW